MQIDNSEDVDNTGLTQIIVDKKIDYTHDNGDDNGSDSNYDDDGNRNSNCSDSYCKSIIVKM